MAPRRAMRSPDLIACRQFWHTVCLDGFAACQYD